MKQRNRYDAFECRGSGYDEYEFGCNNDKYCSDRDRCLAIVTERIQRELRFIDENREKRRSNETYVYDTPEAIKRSSIYPIGSVVIYDSFVRGRVVMCIDSDFYSAPLATDYVCRCHYVDSGKKSTMYFGRIKGFKK